MSKQIKQGIVFMTLFVMLFAFVRAFVIETNVDQAIQYIRRTLYTESGGQSGNVLVDIGFAGDPGSSSHGDNIRAGGDIRSSGDLL